MRWVVNRVQRAAGAKWPRPDLAPIRTGYEEILDGPREEAEDDYRRHHEIPDDEPIRSEPITD